MIRKEWTPPPTEFVIDKKSLHTLKDRAHKIYMNGRQQNANLIFVQALYDEMVHLGIEPKFRVVL